MLAPSSLRVAREFTFTLRDFGQVRRLIHDLAGISLADSKYEMVYHRLSRRLRARGFTQFAHYLQCLEDEPAERELFVNSLTTNLTAFFRENDQFHYLADYVRNRRRTARPLRIWCAASSTGEEAYSIAITVAEAFGATPSGLDILASDLDSEVLATAKRAIYPAQAIADLTKDVAGKYFMRGKNGNSGFVKIKPEVSKYVHFERINLLDRSWPVSTPFDIVFCRNVLIYFAKDTQHRVLEHIRTVLHDDGLLFTGKSESLMHGNGLFRPLGSCIYAAGTRGSLP